MSDAGNPQSPWTGPGIIQNFVSIAPDSGLPEETLFNWLDDVYIPALIKSGVVRSAWRFKAANPAYGKQHMIIYKVRDLAPVQAGKLQEVPRTSDTFPSKGPVEDFVESESRILSLTQLYETAKQPEDAASTIIYAAMEPQAGGAADLDAWYRDEHNQQMSEQPGWKRTTRFDLLFSHRSDGKAAEHHSFLAIHEFGEGHQLGKDVVALEPISDWTKKCMSEAKAIDAAIYNKVKSFA